MPSSMLQSILLLPLALVACADSANNGPLPTPAAGPTSVRSTAAPPKDTAVEHMELTDEQVLGVLSAASDKMVTLAGYATRVSGDPSVRAHAAELVANYTAHRDILREAADGLGLVEQPSTTRLAIQIGFETDFTVLRDADRSDFDRAFLAQIVGDQQGLLRLLDRVLLPATASPRLRVILDVALRHVLETNLESSLRLYRRVAEVAG